MRSQHQRAQFRFPGVALLRRVVVERACFEAKEPEREQHFFSVSARPCLLTAKQITALSSRFEAAGTAFGPIQFTRDHSSSRFIRSGSVSQSCERVCRRHRHHHHHHPTIIPQEPRIQGVIRPDPVRTSEPRSDLARLRLHPRPFSSDQFERAPSPILIWTIISALPHSTYRLCVFAPSITHLLARPSTDLLWTESAASTYNIIR